MENVVAEDRSADDPLALAQRDVRHRRQAQHDARFARRHFGRVVLFVVPFSKLRCVSILTCCRTNKKHAKADFVDDAIGGTLRLRGGMDALTQMNDAAPRNPSGKVMKRDLQGA